MECKNQQASKSIQNKRAHTPNPCGTVGELEATDSYPSHNTKLVTVAPQSSGAPGSRFTIQFLPLTIHSRLQGTVAV